jgi:hypothetical protein
MKPKMADVWRERVMAQQGSGQTIRAWCRQNNCHEHAFYGWRCRLGLSPRAVSKRREPPGKPMKFAEVVVGGAGLEPIRLRLGGGRELMLPASMPVESIARLVRAIEGAS